MLNKATFHKVLLIIPYFGKWPLWFDAFLISIEKNPSINWLCPTDCEAPKKHPKNIEFLSITLEELNVHVNEVVGVGVPLTPRKFCDLKPAYGDIFHDYIGGYDFWGICDMDIIWGNIRKFITKDVLEDFDIISSRKEAISGHFTLFRNTPKINSLYKSIPNYRKLFRHPKFQWTDEVALTRYLKEKSAIEDKNNIRIFWPKILCNQERGKDSRQEYYLDKWLWKMGEMLEIENGKVKGEVMYLHFINWKRTMKYSKVLYKQNPKLFYISFIGIHYHTHSLFNKYARRLVNLFNGYYVILKRKQLMKRISRRF